MSTVYKDHPHLDADEIQSLLRWESEHRRLGLRRGKFPIGQYTKIEQMTDVNKNVLIKQIAAAKAKGKNCRILEGHQTPIMGGKAGCAYESAL